MVKWRTKGTGARIAAAVVTLCAVAVLPGQAAAAEVPEYQMAEEAKPIKGAASSGDAPEIKPGFYTDTIARGEEKYYSVTLDATSTAYISAVAAPKPGTKVASYGDGIELELKTTSGEKCDTSGAASFKGGEVSYPIGDYAARRIGGGIDTCQQAGPYLFSVKRKGKAASDPGEWPVEIRYMREPGLKGSIPGPPGQGTWSSEPPTQPTGQADQAKGGTSLNDAGAIGPGVWKDRIQPGETRFYRVPVDWGQQLFAAAELPNAEQQEEGSSKYVSKALGLNLFNPARADIVDDNFTSYDGDQASAPLGLRPVEYGNRFDDEGRGASIAGWYYLQVTVHQDLAQYFPKGANVTLRVKFRGEPKEAPDYDGDAVAAGFGVTDEDRKAAEQGLTAADVADSDSKQLIAWAGIGAGTVLILGLALWVLIARRRAAAAAAQPPYPTTVHQQPGYGPPDGWQR
ncbi:hypothetical protein [Streptomyces gobiensis]|uniref:hypothetical protein n=1 Tax=Streptomyces gobiensis TaxID=2875706 RepID=UPI001E34E363|nr:hypothetical protein [Streptomyces gobiensis]UGY92569.1 hypothetical protein test1122_13120 [Streptomyces gobiensis]